MRNRRWILVAGAVLATSCGGGGGGGGAVAPPAAGPQSAGGAWIAATPPVSELVLLIAETGELRTMAPTPEFGAGAAIVTNNDHVSGAFQTRALSTSLAPPASPPLDRDCSFEGTVRTRASLNLVLTCTDSGGTTTVRTMSFVYDASYDTPSTLAGIAGNYTLEPRASTNTLNINSDGTLFGMLDNGAQCLMNGTVEIIDARFELHRLKITLSNCTRLSQYEGIEFTGLARRNAQVPGGGFFALITAAVNGRLEVMSLLYTRV
jgi:hypothetical protein